MHVGVTYNLKRQPQSNNDQYAEWDTRETIDAVSTAFNKKHNVTLIEADERAFKSLKSSKPDIVFNMAEGLRGAWRESLIPTMLEALKIPYTGSDPLTLATCLDKSKAKEILRYYNIPTPDFEVIYSMDQRVTMDQFPAVVKPIYEGSSKGIPDSALVKSYAELTREVERILKTYDEPAMIEKFLEGREFTVALLGNADEIKVLPFVEICFDALPSGLNPIYSYDAKWVADTEDNPLNIFKCPANIPSSLREGIENMCIRAFKIFRIRDWCRMDIRLDNMGTPYILELNPLPGILPNPLSNSCFPKAARAMGLSYDELILRVLDIACKRYGIC